ncbi:thiolase family protein [Gordonia sp. HY285]|uniref:Thiolase family protein n=1 Tax=Gordonia liuliyuniae TaxID=2911517 RepID=A0ABS9ITR1_9ACTN|nr:thiolase family protein [Gordonia liuliyuniae]MCF8588961.1 thiolase family protein [Gordonia liuliyuniae]MCF8609158.1 thiolase family protein [Gordonia liuliyuniae]
MRNAVIVDVVRSASGRGKPGGALSGVHPIDLLADVLRSLMERNEIDPVLVDDVVGGCVSQASEQAGNITRAASLAAGLPESTPATTVTRACGSSQQAVQFAAQGVVAGAYDVVIACGVESMSRVPMGTASMGHDLVGTGLAQRYPEGWISQGVAAELVARKYGLTRDDVDAYAAQSHGRAAASAAAGHFDREIVPVTTPDGLHTVDETIRAGTTTEGLGGLRPSFYSAESEARFPDLGWMITPGNSSPLTDAAAATLIMSEEKAIALGLTPRARVVDFTVAGDDPVIMLTAPIPATRKLLDRTGLTIDAVDVYEVNEAFASVPLAWARAFDADPSRLNPAGGAISLGHAIGASGVRLLATMVGELERTDGRYGLQTMCEHGGMANALLIERI